MRCACLRAQIERALGVCRLCFAERRLQRSSSPQMVMTKLGDREVGKKIRLGIPYEILIQN